MSGSFKALQIRNFIKITAVGPKLRRFRWDTCKKCIEAITLFELELVYFSSIGTDVHFYVGSPKSSSRRNRQSDFDKILDLSSSDIEQKIVFYD